MLIIPHELGHAIMGELCGFHVKEIRFCPYGGNTVFDSLSNSSLKEEWMVLLAGPMMQMIVFYLLSFVLPVDDFEILKMYHFALLGFNLLPFYPLDGGKAVQLLFASFLPYYRSLLVTVLISLAGLSVAILFSFSAYFHFDSRLCKMFGNVSETIFFISILFTDKVLTST